MPGLDFFAARADLLAVLTFVFEQTDLRTFESYSRLDHELREFRSVAEVTAAFDVGNCKSRTGHEALLKLWSANVMPEVQFRRIHLQLPGHEFRYAIEGLGLIHLYLGGLHGLTITTSSFGHFSEAGARRLGGAGGVDWALLKRTSGKLRYHIGRRIAVAKVPGRPILRSAAEHLERGYTLQPPWDHHVPTPISRVR